MIYFLQNRKSEALNKIQPNVKVLLLTCDTNNFIPEFAQINEHSVVILILIKSREPSKKGRLNICVTHAGLSLHPIILKES